MSDSAGVILLAGRIVLALFFAFAGYRHLTGGQHLVGYAQSVGFPVPAVASWPTGAWLVAASVSIGAGIWPDIGALMLIAFLVPAAAWFHTFWKVPEDQVQTQTQYFWRNVALVGACVALFGVFTGLDDGLRFAVTSALIDLT
ncbi:MAG: DoxX family protein [Acidimicrobiales bacterium]